MRPRPLLSRVLAAGVGRLSEGWKCRSCGKIFLRLNLVLKGHSCRPSISALPVHRARRQPARVSKKQIRPRRRFCVLKPWRPRKKTKSHEALTAQIAGLGSATATSTAAVALPRDLAYADIAEAAKTARLGGTVAMQLNPSSIFNGSRLRFLLSGASKRGPELAPAVGQTAWLAESKCYAAVASVGGPDAIEALLYQREGGACGCSQHAADGAGACWRLAKPLRSVPVSWQPDIACRETLVPRVGAPASSGSKPRLEKPWHRCYRVAARSSPDNGVLATTGTEELLAATAGAFEDFSTWRDAFSQACADVYESVAVVPIRFTDPDGNPAVPRACPDAGKDDKICQIVNQGRQPGPRVLSSVGVRASLCQKCKCKAHGRVWSVPVSACASGGASLSADVVGKLVVTGDFWPSALLVFEETECYEAVRRHVTAATADSMARSLSQHPRLGELSGSERAVLLRAFDRAADLAPDPQTFGSLLSAYANAVWTPLCVDLSRYALAATGAVLNMDFSASDCRQLSCRALGGRNQRKRVFGGLAALEDIPPLPPLYCPIENRPQKEKLLLTALTLMQLDGARPMGANTDNLAADFSMMVSCLQAALPPGTVVMQDSPADDFIRAQMDAGRIVVDRSTYKVFGFELGEDPLHIYMRLLGAIHISSREAAWAIRCLRKALGSWNPLVRAGHDGAEHQDAQDELLYAAADTAEGRGPAQPVANLPSILSAYFRAQRLPQTALKMVQARASDKWTHPDNGAILPPCAKAVVIDDIARWANPGVPRAEATAVAYRACYESFPTAESIRSDLQGLMNLLRLPCFAGVPRDAGTAWHRAQHAYLLRLQKRRPVMRREDSAQPAATSLQAVPAGHQPFCDAVQEQCKDVHVHGLLAAFRIKAWAHAHGFDISLGSIGVERLWRNIQRQARNKGRSQASLSTVRIIILSRWMRLLQSRLLRIFHARGHANTAHLAQLLLSKEKLAAALAGETQCKTPIASASRAPALPLSEAEIGRVYSVFTLGNL
ncbi:unnamed protein product [Prorocentrum cordatum]|uniref:C2H2-type domain-containing protein n=2 Tax=Prorocentrum cordatum TaxID=2364126 RepID=A0ABN9PWP1_9DINO|nr:unnamed protein product [Polarella glacialis]